jgi:hypothetical protein
LSGRAAATPRPDFSIVTAPAIADAAPRRVDRTLLAAGLLQLVAMLAPAARVRLAGPLPFYRVPSAGPALAVLAVLTVGTALLRRGRWRATPSALSAVVLAVVYWRLARAPSGSFIDPVLRHAVDPSWGFVPMGVAVLVGLVGAVRARSA